MKSCPSCNLKYADETLQFCLNDGTQLIEFSDAAEEPATIVAGARQTAEKSRSGHSNFEPMPAGQTSSELLNNNKNVLREKQAEDLLTTPGSNADDLFFKVLTFAPIVVALMQNYWQWLYMAKYDSFRFPAFIWEVNFWIWLFLLLSGTALCTLAIKNNKNRGFAIVGLVILAINLLLCLVPRR